MRSLAKFRPNPSTKLFPDGLFDDFFNRSIADFVGSDVLITQPAVNILETETSFVLEVAAPGFDKQQFEIQVADDVLTVRAKHDENEQEKQERFTRRTYRFEAFERTFRLPQTVNQDGVSAVYENGILIVTLPKKEEAVSSAKAISIG